MAFLSTCPQQGTSAEGSLKVTESAQSTLLCLFLQLATMVTCSLYSISLPKTTTVFTFKDGKGRTVYGPYLIS